ncbi:hypothetical protein [Nannocystis punicea]|uniref:Uncharacterized protein n=1 Tax=Nannocystis punicea TaxID=2995304 RepID=A0ABY7GUN2_9BACT|nr:hypothetical protein [Nannocystis poenicansa]WAS90605.1 hypothetical protein O0S08_30835 [Nannocystis poenicansa]
MPTPTRTGVCWGSIFAGTLVAVGAWLLLHLLGMGIGLTAIQPHHPGSLRSVGVGTGVWTLIAPILALFVGGLVVGKLAGPLDRASGAIHGIVVWALATVASITLLWMALTAVIGGAVTAGASVASATAGGAVAAVGAGAIGEISPESLGLSTDDLLAPVNRRLQSEGKPAITGEQLMTAAKKALRSSVREGRLDRQLVINALAENTALSPAEAADIAGQIERGYDARLRELGETARTRALEAVEGTGKALLGLSLAMLLGLGAAVGGALVGVHRYQQGGPRGGRRTYVRAE